MSRGRVLKLKAGDLIGVGDMVVKIRTGKAEVYVYGEDEIIPPDKMRLAGSCDTKEEIHKIWEVVKNGSTVD